MSTSKAMPYKEITSLRVIIIIFTLATALVHFSLLFPNPMFILNGLGYLALLAAYFLPLPVARDNPGLVRWVFIGFTAITILAWLAIGDKSWWLGYVDKIIEIGLIACLWIDGRS
jgi:4-hydroxybenzoate polyprenyltransferase